MGSGVDAIVLARGGVRGLRDALHALGLRGVVELAREDEALEAAIALKPRMLVADHAPPDLDGIRFLGLTRVEHPTACRVLIVDEMRFDLVQMARSRAGVHGLLQRPVLADASGPVLARALDLSREPTRALRE